MEEILKVVSLSKSFPMEKDHSITIRRLIEPKEWFKKNEEFYAVQNVSFSLNKGDCIGLVGETGAGKTTTCLTIARLLEANSGQIFYKGHEISRIRPREFAKHELRRSLQMIFQDPTEALNPAYSAFKTIANPLIHLLKMKDRRAIRKRVTELADMAYFPLKLLDRYPHQLSGGEKARVGIARAFATKPDLILLDEPTSALDVSVQGGVLILLEKLRKELDITYLFVSHDLSVVRLMCTRVMIMLEGQIVEEGTVEEVFNHPKHKHTQDLIRSIPNISRRENHRSI